MDNHYSSYGQIILQLLGQLLKGGGMQNTEKIRETGAEELPEKTYFAGDGGGETRWRREERIELLAQFCREGYAMASKYGHFLIGTGDGGSFVAVPGRFLLSEQPAGGATGFTLWKPLAGGEELYDSLDDMTEDAAEAVYGYWIARLNPETLKISEV